VAGGRLDADGKARAPALDLERQALRQVDAGAAVALFALAHPRRGDDTGGHPQKVVERAVAERVGDVDARAVGVCGQGLDGADDGVEAARVPTGEEARAVRVPARDECPVLFRRTPAQVTRGPRPALLSDERQLQRADAQERARQQARQH
jgi:hypothetical protein